MRVKPHVIAHWPAPELVAGRVVNLAQDIPQSDIDSADGGAPHDPIAVPEVLAIHHLPEMLDARWIFPDEQRRDVFDGAHNRARMPFERRLAPAVKTSVIRQHLDEDPVAH